jgi:hypothetical protein
VDGGCANDYWVHSPMLESHPMSRSSSRLLHVTVLGGLLSAALVGACTSGPIDGAGGRVSKSTGLPCDVAAVIDNHCSGCHSDPPTAGAPTPLLTPEELMAPSVTEPTKNMAEVSVERMQAPMGTMPPAGGATAEEIAALQTWIDAGYPLGDCEGTSNPDPAFTGPSICTSMKFWGANNFSGHERMQPGKACVACHKSPPPGSADEPLPKYTAAGTVYPTGHEPDLCYGIDGVSMSDVVVHIVGADGVDHVRHVNATGNFSYTGTLALPYTARVESAAGTRVMSEPQDEGDCNLCHTDAAGGNMSTAPGRIVVP